jgi:photosystem II stability/assembly factor-like uncharacterized protein
MSSDPWSGRVFAGVALQGLYATDNNGNSWQRLGAGSGSASITNRPSAVIFDPENPDRFWESGIYTGGGIYTTTNRGSTFTQLGTIFHNDFMSVDMYDSGRKTLLAGGHEQARTVYRSTDGGATWNNIGNGLPADSNFSSYPFVLDSDSYLVGACGYGSGMCGVWRTHDGGATWAATASQIFPGAPPMWHSNGKIYWTAVGNSGLFVSNDLGVTWTYAAAGVSLPVELPDGRMLAVGNMRIMISSDGTNWTAIGQQTPFQPHGVTYSAWTKTMYIFHGDCGNVVPSDGIAKAGFDWQQ